MSIIVDLLVNIMVYLRRSDLYVQSFVGFFEIIYWRKFKCTCIILTWMCSRLMCWIGIHARLTCNLASPLASSRGDSFGEEKQIQRHWIGRTKRKSNSDNEWKGIPYLRLHSKAIPFNPFSPFLKLNHIFKFCSFFLNTTFIISYVSNRPSSHSCKRC